MQRLFDLDASVLMKMREEFPENWERPAGKAEGKAQGDSSQRKGPTPAPLQHGLRLDECLVMLTKYTNLTQQETQRIHLSLDHVHPGHITWKEFLAWLQGQGEARDLAHNAELYEVGNTRIEEGELIQFSTMRVEPKIEYMLPIALPDRATGSSQASFVHVVFVIFENRIAKFYNRETMKCLHRLHFDISYPFPAPKLSDSRPT